MNLVFKRFFFTIVVFFGMSKMGFAMQETDFTQDVKCPEFSLSVSILQELVKLKPSYNVKEKDLDLVVQNLEKYCKEYREKKKSEIFSEKTQKILSNIFDKHVNSLICRSKLDQKVIHLLRRVAFGKGIDRVYRYADLSYEKKAYPETWKLCYLYLVENDEAEKKYDEKETYKMTLKNIKDPKIKEIINGSNMRETLRMFYEVNKTNFIDDQDIDDDKCSDGFCLIQ